MSGQSVDGWLEASLARKVSAIVELEAKGHRDSIAVAAVERAWGAAWKRVEAVSAAIRAQAFYDTFLAELRLAEPWCEQERQGLTGR